MINFIFKVNESFLNYPAHPITIPKATYSRLENEELDDTDVTIVCPDGTRMAAEMYSGQAGYGFYYQIRCHAGRRRDPLFGLKIGQLLKIEIERASNHVIVRLRPISSDQPIAPLSY